MTDSPPREGPTQAGNATNYRWFVLAMLFLTYASSSVDRTLLSIVGQAVKDDFGIADWQLGLLNGLTFSLFYATLGLPLARVADRRNRVNLISICLLVWSVMTTLSGMAANFVQLVLFRLGVGIGEAGCLPTSHSLIANYFRPSQRSSALALFGLGLPFGGLIAMVAGGFLADQFGWRATFLMLGLPGVALALLFKLTIREPARLRDALNVAAPEAATDPSDTIFRSLRRIVAIPSVRHIMIGMTLTVLFSSPGSVFAAPYLVRRFGLSYSEIGLLLGLAQMSAISVSAAAGGFLADWLGRKRSWWYLAIPAISIMLAGPTLALAFAFQSLAAFTAFLFATSLLGAAYVAPSYAMLHRLVSSNAAATTTALCNISVNLIGLGLGPLLAGLAIDKLTERAMSGEGLAGFAQACVRGKLPETALSHVQQACSAAQIDATRTALIAFALMMIWPALHYVYAALRLPEAIKADAN